MTDLSATSTGSIVLFSALTRRGKRWFEKHVGDPACEMRFAMDILYGAQEDGLTISINGEECRLEPK